MVTDYKDILNKTKASLEEIGFNIIRDEDFIAIFSNAEGWSVLLEGDRVQAPAFTLSASKQAAENPATSYAIWILMLAFVNQIPVERRKPSLDNQLWFISCFYKKIFNDEASYRSDYDKILNDGY